MQAEDVSLVFHKTSLQPLRRMLHWIAFNREDLFYAYQAVHSVPAERTLAKRNRFASFVPYEDDQMLFVGLFDMTAVAGKSAQEIYANPAYFELEREFGATDTAPAVNIARDRDQLFFETNRAKELVDLNGRLLVSVPAGRAYVRLATNLDLTIDALLPVPVTEPALPPWRHIVLSGSEMRQLPRSWEAKLSEWRGIYLILDKSDGARYVGAAYGVDNVLGRWRAHVARDKGVTVELAQRSPENFQFAILERVSPDAQPADVIAIERNWMARLDTINYGLNS
ncbi:GIY-YIG nuclease family protein [uncultured Tateyamaria sp.]|uniref:GIY-YIG nuclease family protein n=1 Tax=uncultured Tateyamaria sp. TaxID=455651 RepID=UPI002626226A|nr:GIY-YIG nuclease family protein [uncultured Tateyamaria sp.]